jgi:hypothetical protein
VIQGAKCLQKNSTNLILRSSDGLNVIPPPERLESSFWEVRGGNAWADRFHLPRSVIRCAI